MIRLLSYQEDIATITVQTLQNTLRRISTSGKMEYMHFFIFLLLSITKIPGNYRYNKCKKTPQGGEKTVERLEVSVSGE